MNFRNKLRIRVVTLFTLLAFFGSTLATYAQEVTIPVPTAQTAPQSNALSGIANLIGASPEITQLQNNVGVIEGALSKIENIAAPLYNKVAPTNMETMSIGERIRAIVDNTKGLVNGGAQSYKAQVAQWNEAHGITPDTSFEGELSVGLNEVGVQAGQLPLNGKGNVAVGKLKQIIDAIKSKLQAIISIIKAKIIALAQKIGLMKKKTDNDQSGKKSAQDTEEAQQATAQTTGVQQADTFSARLSKGISDGTSNAKQSLKNSFSFTNLAVTTTVAVGTNLALQVIKGEKPSIGAAVKSVASAEFAGSVVGGALGAAGGQFVGTLVKTIIPGPIGAIAGALAPVMMGSAGSIMGSSLGGDIKNRQFSITKAIKAIDPVDLVGSSVGSTIGMALGAPIPIIGPIIGGIVGGIIGSKIAKWISNKAKGISTGGSLLNVFKGGTQLPTTGGGTNLTNTQGLTIGGTGSLNTNGNGQINTSGLIPVGSQEANATSGSPDLQKAEQKYYETYLKYNRLVEAGQTTEAKKVFAELKVYSDQYNALKAQAKTK